jgi:DNA invertase Pin-like site-specific DNA recombinase
MAELAQIRAEAVAELRDDGWTFERIGQALGISRQQVYRIARRE